MKKFSATLTALVVVSSLIAQQSNLTMTELRPSAHPIDLDAHHFTSEYEPVNRAGSGAISIVLLGTSYNIYSVLLDDQNQVSYDPELGAVAFVHRHNDGTPGGSGGLAFDRSVDGGATWTDNYALSPGFNDGSITTVGGNRYPSGTIWNPAGNTDPANAYFVANGPALQAGAAGWGWQFRMSANLNDGSNISEDYYQIGVNTDFHPYALSTTANGDMWSMSTYYIGSDPSDYDFMYLNKGVFNTGTNMVDWATPSTTITPAWSDDTTDGTNVAGFGWGVAFGPDGNTGYAVALGSQPASIFQGIQPIVWKTTDAGATWNQLPQYDFRTMPMFTDYLIPTGDGDQIPFFTSMDLVVDENDALNLFAEVSPRSSSSVDSLYFLWQNAAGLFHLNTSDGSSWIGNLVDSALLADGAVGDVTQGNRPQISRTADGSKLFFSYVASDGSLTGGTNDLPNVLARGWDVATGEYTFVKNITGGSAVDGITYFATMAHMSITGGDDHDYEMPIVFAEPDAAGDLAPPQYYYIKGAGFDEGDFGALAPQAVADFDAAITDNTVNFTNLSSNANEYVWDYGDGSALSAVINPTHVYDAVGTYTVCLTAKNEGSPATDDEACKDVTITNVVSGIADVELNNALDIFPTPSSGMINIDIRSNEFRNATVEVFNLVGKRVMEPTAFNIANGVLSLDLSDLSNGQYMVKVQTANAVTARQITLAR